MKLKLSEYLGTFADKYKYPLLICLAGIMLVLFSGGQKPADTATSENPSFDVKSIESEAEKLFSKIEGVGKVKVKLMLKSGFETVYAYDDETRLSENERDSRKKLCIISSGGGQNPLKVTLKYPEYCGAVIVCEGGDDAELKLVLTGAMKSLTGISSDNIVVAKMKK